MNYKLRVIALILAAAYCSAARAASLGFDSAADSAYNDGWQTGDNGGSGFAAWSLSVEYAFTASSTTNGVGDPGNDGDIDTAGRAWGLATYTPTVDHQSSFASRPFTGALTLGQQFVMDIDSGPSGGFGSGYSGFALLDSTGNAPFVLQVSGGGLFIQGGSTGVSFSDQGFHVVFTLTAADAFNVTISGVGSDGSSGLPVSVNGPLGPASGGGLVGVMLFAVDTGPDVVNWQFFNSMAIIPEPSSLVLVAFSTLALFLTRRRQQRNIG